MAEVSNSSVDLRSGFCKSNSIFVRVAFWRIFGEEIGGFSGRNGNVSREKEERLRETSIKS